MIIYVTTKDKDVAFNPTNTSIATKGFVNHSFQYLNNMRFGHSQRSLNPIQKPIQYLKLNLLELK